MALLAQHIERVSKAYLSIPHVVPGDLNVWTTKKKLIGVEKSLLTGIFKFGGSKSHFNTGPLATSPPRQLDYVLFRDCTGRSST